MLRDFLTLTSVQVSRETVSSDGMGGTTTTTSVTTLLYSMIYQSGTFNKLLSDRINRDSTHVLITEPDLYSWNQNDRNILYGGNTYKIIGRPDNVFFEDEITVVPLELIS